MSFDFQAAYDELNPADDDYRFYAALAASAGVSRAVDLGCGTGTLTRMLASAGATVTGVDPDPDMLRVARAKDPDGRVDWRLGYSDAIDPGSARPLSTPASTSSTSTATGTEPPRPPAPLNWSSLRASHNADPEPLPIL